MADYLMFQLYGPMASWGDVAVGEARVSANHPGRSALIGLLAAALGIRRDNEAAQGRLAAGYRFAVRIHAAGNLLRDYHTVQVPSRAALKKRPHFTRRDELTPPKDELGTILSLRDYRVDAYYQVAVDSASDPAPWPLTELKQALEQPRFPLYLGRKSCPVALPLQPQLVTAESLDAAFTAARFTDPTAFAAAMDAPVRGSGLANPTTSLYWDDGMASGVAARETFTRRDQPRTRRRWQFDERPEHHATLPGKE